MLEADGVARQLFSRPVHHELSSKLRRGILGKRFAGKMVGEEINSQAKNTGRMMRSRGD